MRPAHPSDRLWQATSSGRRPTIAVIDGDTFATEWTQRQRYGLKSDAQVERVPFGFARALLLDEHGRPICGYPARRRHLGGCLKPLHHNGAHQYDAGNPRATRPQTQPVPTQGAGTGLHDDGTEATA